MREVDFSRPQRQSPIGLIVMFTSTLQDYAKAFFPLIIVMLVQASKWETLMVWGAIAFFFLMIVLISWLRFWNFTFQLDDENREFILTHGILSKTRVVIQYSKIQQVNINQSFLQRIINVYALDVDTAGSQDKEAVIKAVSHQVATGLKTRLMENSRSEVSVSNESITADETTSEQEISVLNISFLTLLKVGITSNYMRTLAVILAFLIPIYENFHRMSGNYEYRAPDVSGYLEKNQPTFIGISIVIGIVLLLFLLTNLSRVLLRYFGYTVSRQKGSLMLSFGLLNTKSTIVRPEKVQLLFVTQNFFQKKLDILELRIRQATNGRAEKENQAIEIPGCSRRETDGILKLLLGSVPEKGVMLKPNYRKVVFAIFLSIVVPLIGFLVFLPTDLMDGFYMLFPIYAALRLLVLFVGFRRYRLYINDRFIIKRSGAWDVTDTIIEPDKIQAVSVSQLFWHKSADIGYLTLHTAGGALSFQLGNYTILKRYVNRWLFEIESGGRDWM